MASITTSTRAPAGDGRERLLGLGLDTTLQRTGRRGQHEAHRQPVVGDLDVADHAQIDDAASQLGVLHCGKGGKDIIVVHEGSRGRGCTGRARPTASVERRRSGRQGETPGCRFAGRTFHGIAGVKRRFIAAERSGRRDRRPASGHVGARRRRQRPVPAWPGGASSAVLGLGGRGARHAERRPTRATRAREFHVERRRSAPGFTWNMRPRAKWPPDNDEGRAALSGPAFVVSP